MRILGLIDRLGTELTQQDQWPRRKRQLDELRHYGSRSKEESPGRTLTTIYFNLVFSHQEIFAKFEILRTYEL